MAPTRGIDHLMRADPGQQIPLRRRGEPLIDDEHGVAVVPDRAEGGDEGRPGRQVEGDEACHGPMISAPVGVGSRSLVGQNRSS